MKLKTAVLLLVIGGCFMALADIMSYASFLITRPKAKFEISDLAYRLAHLATVVGFILWGLTYLKKKTVTATRGASLLITIGAGIWLLSTAYFYVKAYGDFYRMMNYEYILYNLIELLLPVTIFLFGLSLAGQKQRIKRAAWWLAIGGLMYFFMVFFSRVVVIAAGGLSGMNGWRTMANWLGLGAMLFPLGIALLGTLLPDRDTAETDPEVTDDLLENSADLLDVTIPVIKPVSAKTDEPENRIRWWLATFLLASIPVVGTGFLLYWSISRQQVRRGSWAAANMVIMTFSSIVITLWYSSLVTEFVPALSLGVVLIIVIAVMATLAIIATTFNHRNQENLAPGIDDDSPTISEWIGYLLLLLIPLVGLICLIVWASSSENAYRQKWAIARLIWGGVMLLYYFFLMNAIEMFSVYSRNPEYLNF